jgi:putative membrane protein
MLRRLHQAVFQRMLLLAFAVFFVFWLHDPPYELHAVIHVVPTWIAIAILLTSTKYFPLTNTSLVFLILFLTLHVLGTRYVYSFVPYDQWATQLLGIDVTTGVPPSRNHYDRLVHFSFGLLIAPVAREAQCRIWQVKPAWSYFTAVEFVLASSMVFELAEWLGAVTLAPDFADSYLGQQGDVWDAHKDMGLAAMGAVLSMFVAAMVQYVNASSESSADDMRECE